MTSTPDSGFVICGTSHSFGAGKADVIAIKIDSIGNIEWSNAYGGAESESGQSIDLCTDGSFSITGHTSSYGAGDEDVLLLKLSDSGDVQFGRAIGSDLGDFARSIKQTDDQGFIIAGYTMGFGVAHSDVYLIKTDSAGVNVCHDTSISIQASVINPTVNIVSSSVGSGVKTGLPATLTGYTLSNPSEPCDYVIGNDEILNNENLRLFPNPTPGLLNLDWNIQSTELVEVSIIDLNGRLVQKNITPLPSQINLKMLAKGLYVVQVMSSQGLRTKIIVKK